MRTRPLLSYMISFFFHFRVGFSAHFLLSPVFSNPPGDARRPDPRLERLCAQARGSVCVCVHIYVYSHLLISSVLLYTLVYNSTHMYFSTLHPGQWMLCDSCQPQASRRTLHEFVDRISGEALAIDLHEVRDLRRTRR